MENITHKPIMVQDEDRRTEAVVNAAAREPDAAKSDNEPVHNAGELDLEPDEPDFTLYAGAAAGQYFYRLDDVAERLSFTACGRVPLLPDHAALLYAIVNALHSISNTTIGRRLAERYGYSTIRMARQSGKQVRVIIQTADRELSELGRVFAEAERPKLYLSMLTEDDRSRYTELIAETSRFDTSWQAVSPAVPELVAVHKWASELLPTIKHYGPEQSFKTRIHLMERQAKRLATTTPNTSAA
jgi:hypothetical protein